MSSYDINLLTREEKQEQVKTKLVKLSSVLSVFLLILVGCLSFYYFSKAQNLKKSIKEEDIKITSMRNSIQEMSDVEVSARNLFQRYNAIEGIFAERIYYSFLLEHFNSKIPIGVTVNSFNFRGQSEIDISGDAENYLLVSQFLRNLNEVADPQVFTSADLTSVTLNASDRSVKYAIVVSFDVESLKGR